MNVYQINESDWVAAESMQEAIDEHLNLTGLSRSEAVDETAHELTPDEMNGMTFTREDGSTVTFAEELSERIANGDAAGFFASNNI